MAPPARRAARPSLALHLKIFHIFHIGQQRQKTHFKQLFCSIELYYILTEWEIYLERLKVVLLNKTKLFW